MARVALVKLFTGLNLAVSQLSAELRKAGHETRILYFKDYVGVPRDKADAYPVTEYAGVNVYARGREWIWNCYKPVTEQEYRLLIQQLREFGADLVGFSLTSGGLSLATQVVIRLRSELSVPIIWGGTGPTIEPDRCIEIADYVCVHEGERALPELASRLDRGDPGHDVQGIWARKGNTVIRNAAAPLVDLESIAIPDFDPAHAVHIEDDTLRTNVYPHNLGGQYPIMTSRGCPFSCSFCVESVLQDMFGKKGSLRRRSVGVVMEELVWAKENLGITSVLFYDDVFTTHRKWLEEFSVAYKEQVGLPFWCYTYPTTTRREDVQLLSEAGCRAMTMGIQSGSQRILNDRFGRPAPLDRAVGAIRMILDAGIDCFFDLITRVDFETEEDMQATFDLLCSLPDGVKSQGFGNMVRFPNYGYTKKVDEAKAVRAVSEESYRYWHRMYLLALESIPLSTKRAIANDPVYRRHPELLEPLLRTGLPFMFLPDKGLVRRARVLDTAIAQATIPTEFAAEILGSEPAPAGRLPVLS